MKTYGLRHVALNVVDPQKSKDFYIRVLKMELEWEPDPDNIYLTSGGRDNLALHRGSGLADSAGPIAGRLDHLGFAVPTPEDVDAWYGHVRSHGVPIEKELKTHRDGARSFYFRDPDGNVIQIIYHQPIAKCEQQ